MKTNVEEPDQLSGVEVALFALLFISIPLANIVVGHFAYHLWKASNPGKAKAVNALSIMCFLLQCLPIAAITALWFTYSLR